LGVGDIIFAADINAVVVWLDGIELAIDLISLSGLRYAWL
jgi:hypothetical protein